MTRQNAVWRAPMMLDGSVSKVGAYLQPSSGHLGIGLWRFNADGIPTHLIESATGHPMTSLCFGGPENRTLFITEADIETIQTCEVPAPGRIMRSHLA